MKCTCNLKITEDSFKLLIISLNEGQTTPITIPLNTYSRLSIKQGICNFISQNDEFSLFFVSSSQRHQNRLLFALTDSCCIVPIDLFTFKIMKKPCFIPDGTFPALEKSVSQTIHKMFKQRFIEISEHDSETHDPEYISYSCSFFGFQLILLANKQMQKQKVSLFLQNEKEAANWLLSFIKNNTEYAKAAKKIKSANQETKKELNVIKQDAERYRTNNEKWNDDLRVLCANVCMAMSASGHPYLQGEYDVCAKIALTLIAFDESKVTEENIFDITQVICTMIPYENRISEESIKDISQRILKITESVCPQISVFYKDMDWSCFIMFANVISALFTRSFNDVWKLWKWLYESEDVLASLCSFCAAILIFELPVFAAHNTQSIGLTLEYWDSSLLELDINQVLNLSYYLYSHSQKQ